MPSEADKRTHGRLSAYCHVNLTELSLSSELWTSQVESVMRIGARMYGAEGFVPSDSMRKDAYSCEIKLQKSSNSRWYSEPFFSPRVTKIKFCSGSQNNTWPNNPNAKKTRSNNIFTVYSCNDIVPTEWVCFVLKRRMSRTIYPFLAYNTLIIMGAFIYI